MMNDSDKSLQQVMDIDPPPVVEAKKAEEKPAPLSLASLSLGGQLAAQREALGLSVEQAASQMNLAPRQVKALEADNFAALPGMASTRGFIRSYAKLLKIAPEPLLAMLADADESALAEPVTMRRALSTPFSADSRVPIMGSHGGVKWKNVLIPAVLLVLLGLAGSVQQGWLHLPGMANKDALANQAGTDAKAPDAGVAEQAGAAAAASPGFKEDPALAPTLANQVKNEVVEPPPIPLLLKFREDSWIEVRRNDSDTRNAVITAHVAKAGTTERYDQTDARSLTIGNAGGVDVFVNGQAIDLKPNANGNVVRVNLQ